VYLHFWSHTLPNACLSPSHVVMVLKVLHVPSYPSMVKQMSVVSDHILKLILFEKLLHRCKMSSFGIGIWVREHLYLHVSLVEGVHHFRIKEWSTLLGHFLSIQTSDQMARSTRSRDEPQSHRNHDRQSDYVACEGATIWKGEATSLAKSSLRAN
jgi:hypothetical protein